MRRSIQAILTLEKARLLSEVLILKEAFVNAKEVSECRLCRQACDRSQGSLDWRGGVERDPLLASQPASVLPGPQIT